MPASHEATRTGRHLAPLDGIRGLAALAVVVTHVGFESGATFRGVAGAFAARADIGVAIFFVLSGFLLYRPFAAAHEDRAPLPDVRRFLWHRILRIFPAYLVVLAVVLVVHHRDDLTPELVGANLVMGQTYSADLLLPELAQSWTLTTELAWYLFLPFLGMVLLRRPSARSADRHLRVQLAVCVLLMGVSTTYAVAVRSGNLFDPYIAGYWLPHYVGWFALGVVLSVLSVRMRRSGGPGVLRDLAAAPLSCWAMALVLYAIVCTPVAGPRGLTGLTVWEGLAREGLYGAIAVLVMLPAVFGDARRSLTLTALGARPMRFLGDISYAVYLWHFPLLPLAFHLTGTEEFRGGFWLNLAVLLALTIPVATLSWRLVEQPALRLKSWSPQRGRHSAGDVLPVATTDPRTAVTPSATSS